MPTQSSSLTSLQNRIQPASSFLLVVYLSPWAETKALHWPKVTWREHSTKARWSRPNRALLGESEKGSWVVTGMWTGDSGRLDGILNLPPASCVILNTSLNITVPRSPQLQHGDTKTSATSQGCCEGCRSNTSVLHSKFYPPRPTCCLLFIETPGMIPCDCTKAPAAITSCVGLGWTNLCESHFINGDEMRPPPLSHAFLLGTNLTVGNRNL